MEQHVVEWNAKVAEKIIANLEKRRMAGSYAATVDQARQEIQPYGRQLRGDG